MTVAAENRPPPRGVGEWLAVAVATWGGAGLFPVAPGTVGTLATVPVALLLAWWQGWQALLAAAVLVSLVGWWATGVVMSLWRRHDPKEVVVDEAAGYLLAMAMAPPAWWWLMVGFLLFRLFDILKPGPIRWLDGNIHGAWGVMADDLLAGVAAGAIMMVMGMMAP